MEKIRWNKSKPLFREFSRRYGAMKIISPEKSGEKIGMFYRIPEMEKRFHWCFKTIVKRMKILGETGLIRYQEIKVNGRRGAFYVFLTSDGIVESQRMEKRQRRLDSWNDTRAVLFEEMDLI